MGEVFLVMSQKFTNFHCNIYQDVTFSVNICFQEVFFETIKPSRSMKTTHKSHYQVLIAGGGNGGISTAAQLLRKQSNLDIAIIEPSEKHYYQPAWTLVGGGDFDVNDTVRNEADY